MYYMSRYFILITILFLFICSCKNEQIIKLEKVKYKNKPYEQDEKFAYFKGLKPHNNFRKKIQYSESGHPVAHYEFKDKLMEILHGPWASYNVKGNLKASGYYIDGEKFGEWLTYFDMNSGSKSKPVASKESYLYGKLNGPLTTYYSPGKIKDSFNYVLGEKEGIMRKYFNNGNKKFEALYEEGRLKYRTEWYLNGNKRATESFNDSGNILEQKGWASSGYLISELKQEENNKYVLLYDSTGNLIKKTLWTD